MCVSVLTAAPHMCVLTATIGAILNWLFLQHTHVCVFTGVSDFPRLLNVQNLQLISSSLYSATHMCVLTTAFGRPALGQGQKPPCWPKSSKGHYTCVCWQQQLVGQPLTLGYSLSSTWSAKIVEYPKFSIDSFIDLFCYTHVCALSSNWLASPRLGSETSLLAEGFKGSTHMCVLTAAMGGPTLSWFLLQYVHVWVLTTTIGLPKFWEYTKSSVDLLCTTHACAHPGNWSWPAIDVFRNTHLCTCNSNWSANPWPLGAATAALGVPKLLGRRVQRANKQPLIALFCDTDVCVCS